MSNIWKQISNVSFILIFALHQVYEKLCSYLTIPDVALLIYTLECVYALSSLGQATCNAFLHCPGTLDVLISLLTIEVFHFQTTFHPLISLIEWMLESVFHFNDDWVHWLCDLSRFQAQSYGSKARILMNVVETVAEGETVASHPQFTPLHSTMRPIHSNSPAPSAPSTPPPLLLQPVNASVTPLSSKIQPSRHSLDQYQFHSIFRASSEESNHWMINAVRDAHF